MAGIILTASHNPRQWNALKLLNAEGEFISAEMGQKVLELGASEQFEFAEVDDIGRVERNNDYLHKHMDAIFALEPGRY